MRRFAGFIASRLRSARVVATISFRNLIRQFRRNALLGLGIALGMCILVLTSSFTNGLSDILFNKVLVNMTGHIQLLRYEYTNRRSDVIRDKVRFMAAIKGNVEGVTAIEENVAAFSRGIGNGKTGLLALVGLRRDAAFYEETQLEQGDPRDIYRGGVFPGIILYKNTARDLNVGMNDIVTVRFETIYGQAQAPKFKVVGLIPSENMFMDMAAFVDMEVLRGLLNLETGGVSGPDHHHRLPGKLGQDHRPGQQAVRGADPASGRTEGDDPRRRATGGRGCVRPEGEDRPGGSRGRPASGS